MPRIKRSPADFIADPITGTYKPFGRDSSLFASLICPSATTLVLRAMIPKRERDEFNRLSDPIVGSPDANISLWSAAASADYTLSHAIRAGQGSPMMTGGLPDPSNITYRLGILKPVGLTPRRSMGHYPSDPKTPTKTIAALNGRDQSNPFRRRYVSYHERRDPAVSSAATLSQLTRAFSTEVMHANTSRPPADFTNQKAVLTTGVEQDVANGLSLRRGEGTFVSIAIRGGIPPVNGSDADLQAVYVSPTLSLASITNSYPTLYPALCAALADDRYPSPTPGSLVPPAPFSAVVRAMNENPNPQVALSFASATHNPFRSTLDGYGTLTAPSVSLSLAYLTTTTLLFLRRAFILLRHAQANPTTPLARALAACAPALEPLVDAMRYLTEADTGAETITETQDDQSARPMQPLLALSGQLILRQPGLSQEARNPAMKRVRRYRSLTEGADTPKLDDGFLAALRMFHEPGLAAVAYAHMLTITMPQMVRNPQVHQTLALEYAMKPADERMNVLAQHYRGVMPGWLA